MFSNSSNHGSSEWFETPPAARVNTGDFAIGANQRAFGGGRQTSQ